MMRSLYSAISGLKNHQVRMDIIGNNIANVNTTGYKRSRATFATALSQTLKGASAPTANQGGTNPVQVGLGAMLSSIDQVMTQGSSQSTGKNTDIMIQGSGFFVLYNAGQTVYSRSGAFSQDSSGYLIDPGSGAKVMGFMWGVNDSVAADFTDTDATDGDYFGPIRFSQGDPANPNNTANFTIDDTVWSDNGDGTWSYRNPALIGATATSTNGTVDANTGTITYTGDTAPVSTTVDITDYSGTKATLESFSIDQNGVITGVYSNGTASATKKIGQIALASFANDAGLTNLGGSFYAESNNSGAADIGAANTSGRGSLVPNTVEMSNVDLSQEFTDMIVTQRGFQANSRVITVSDTLLQELIDLKRS